jgi:hypothetical protein
VHSHRAVAAGVQAARPLAVCGGSAVGGGAAAAGKVRAWPLSLP